ncbi:MAG: DUF1972 domain-containing protein [Cryomorphaceae bacterium]|nr:DUF1972 domain-containing protein [Cryomorphaceae bacterium]
MRAKDKKRVAIIGTVGVPANYGGFETLTEHLISDLGNTYDITVYCSGKTYGKEVRKKEYKGANLKYLPIEANGIQSIFYDSLSIFHAMFTSDVLLILGVAGAWMLPFVKLFTNKKIIISIDGIEWKRDKWNLLAQWYLFWAESIAVKYSHIDISDNEAIQDYTAARYGSLSRIIEYGADHTMNPKITKSAIEQYPFLVGGYAFKVCRIEPENNVHVVLEAFSIMEKMPLVMVGNWGKSEYGKNLKAKYQNHSNIFILDPIYDQKQLDMLRSNASVYIHGHSAGGTNPSLVEAMYLGLPIIAYGVSYNRVTTENRALYFYSCEDLIAQVESLGPTILKEMSQNLQAIAKRRYTWKNVAFKYHLLVQEALTGQKKMSVIPNAANVSYQTLLDKGVAHLKTSNNI